MMTMQDIEGWLGTPLFLRRHRAVEPTPACQVLASSLAMSFASIAESVETVRSTRRHDTITIGATLAFSTFWLLPRLSECEERIIRLSAVCEERHRNATRACHD